MASTFLSLTSCTASTASCPLALASETTPSTLDFARVQAALPLAAKMSVICEASRVTSSRSACRSAWISPLAADAALPLSRTASLASRVVSRTVSLIVPDVLDMDVLHCELEIFPCRQPGADRKSTRLNSSHSQISYAVFCLKKKKIKYKIYKQM